MIKSVGKRFLSIALVLVMVLSLLPVIQMPASAANVNTGVTGLTAESSGNATWTASGGSVQASKQSGCTGDSFTAQTGALTFTNNSGAVAQLTFDYSVTLSGGSVEIDGAAVTAGASFSKTVEAGGKVAVKITSNASDDKATTISISNLKLTAEQNVDVTFSAPVNGAYTVNGEAITAQTVKTFKTTDSVALAATPASGCKFFGWYSSAANGFIAFSASVTTSFSEATTVEPRFVPDSAPVFQVGSMLFTDLNEAISYSQTSGIAKIVLISDGTLPAGNYTIPNGKMLVIPFDEAQTVYTTAPGMTTKADGTPAAHVNPSAFRTLTMASGANITVASGGAVCVPSMVSAVGTNSGSWNATPTGKHGRITMNTGSSIDVQSGGKLYAWGYIAGSGSVYARSGAEIWECFQIRCWRGGTATSNMAGNSQKVFPLNQYYVQNIEAPITYYPGATEKVFAAVNMSSKQFGASATFIGSGGMFQISNGTATKRFTGASDRLELSVDGDFAINPMSLRITGLPLVGTLDLNTEDYVLPIQSNITIKVNSGTTTFSQDVAFLPGSEMIIANGAAATIANGHKAYVYDKDQWGAYAAGGAQLVVVGYSTVNGTTAKRTAASLVDAKIDVNGTLNAAGQIYTTESGAAIVSSQGTGVFRQQANPGTDTNTYMATQSGSDMTYVSIPITAARLQNADGTYVETADKAAGTEIPYVNGVWGGTPVPTYTVTWVNADGTVLKTLEDVPEGTTVNAADYDGAAPTMPADEYAYTFTGWDAPSAVVNADVTFTAQYDKQLQSYSMRLFFRAPGIADKEATAEPIVLTADKSMKLTATATYTTGGKTYYFDHWEFTGADGVTLQYPNRIVTVRPAQGGEYSAYAVYAETEKTDFAPFVMIIRDQTVGGKLVKTLTYSLPDGYALQENSVGFRVYEGSEEIGSAFSTVLRNDTGTYTVTVLNPTDDIRVVGQVTYVKDGDEQTITTG